MQSKHVSGRPLRGCVGALSAVLFCAAVSPAAARAAGNGEPDPVQFCKNLMMNGNLRTQGTGEGFAWHASAGTETFLDAYLVYKDPEWLEQATKFYDVFLSKLQKDPDGYEGWIGDPIAKNGDELSTDALVGDAILCAPLAHFAEIVKKDPALQARFGKIADKYQALATRIMWDKWNHRNCYYLDAAGWGSYHTYGKLIDMKHHKWVDAPSNEISDNLNKHYAASLVFLRLWRITGDQKYKDRIIQICSRAKSMWRWFPDENRVVWNYWMPHGPYDMEGRAPRSWVGVHPDRPGYQAWETSMFVEVYDSGLVFDKSDFALMINTNHWMADGPGGTWRSADGTSKAGMLWSAFARFDDAIRTKYEAELAKPGIENQVSRDYLAYVMKKAPGWQRLYVTDPSQVDVVKMPLQPGKFLTMTVVIPDVIETADDSRVQFATQTKTAGKLKIELLDKAGKDVLGTLDEIDVGKDGEYNAPLWDGTNPKTGKKDIGEYQVRWTLGSESRTQPVWVTVGTAKKHEGPEAMKPGEKITMDFEKPLDKRWSLEQAVLSTEQAHSGTHSLKIDSTAQFKFGQYDDLPVKITMWVYDTGEKHGKKTTNGPAWGVSSASGDKFCMYDVWRSYFDGDHQVSWVNTGENQWFNPHPAGVQRQSGWVEWVFDFTDPKAPEITADGKPVKKLLPKFTPAGATSVYFLHGDAGPLYVDDITIDYPKK